MSEYRIVVGVDGSAGSRAALGWAVGEGRVRGWPVHAICAWDGLGVEAARQSGWTKAVTMDLERDSALAVVEEALRELGPHPDVVVIPEAVPGEGAQALIEASKDADLLVVGSRGLGGFKELLLGSVSRKCTLYAHCPVVIIPDRQAA